MAVTIQNGEAQNKLGNPNGKPSYSSFPIHKHRYTTERFGINDVCGVFNGIEADKIDWRPAHELTTYTLSAPLMTPVYKEKDYIAVARCAILPFNWDKIHVQPNIGEDIDATTIGTSVKADEWVKMYQKPFNWAKDAVDAIQTEFDHESEIECSKLFDCIKKVFQGLICAEYFFSYGSLLSKMGAKFASLYKSNEGRNPYDLAFDSAISAIINNNIVNMEIAKADDSYIVEFTKEDYTNNVISVREFLDIVRESPGEWRIEKITTGTGEYSREDTLEEGEDDDLALMANTVWSKFKPVAGKPKSTYEKPVDLARMWAYQLANAEYFTNSHVDYIYSAELYRQYVWSILINLEIPQGEFTWNGITYNYDYLSAYYFHAVADIVSGDDVDYEAEYLASIFTFRRSLKYLDYFTGSKTRPLAVGDVTINPGAGGAINVIDVTRKGQAYKFLNAVNRIGRKAEDYALEIMGVKQHHDWHNPLWLGSTRTSVTGTVTDNTGEAQMENANAQTSRLYGVDGKYKFTFDLDRNTIVVGITFYDVERSYFKGVHRSFMHVDRYDMYNPYLQYTGDQNIMGEEYAAGNENTFGYTPSYEEFKQEYNTADAGFVVALPGYTFLDGLYNNDRETEDGGSATHIGPNFIRSKSVEFDRFYNSLTGYSLGTYFHFILDYYNDLNAKRKMAFNPGIAL